MLEKKWLILLLALCCLGVSAAPLEISCRPGAVTAFQGEKVVIAFTIINRLAESIRPDQGYFLSYHLYRPDGRLLAFENRRFPIPAVLRRGKSTQFSLPLFFDAKEPGDYRVEFDIVKEGEFWGASRKWQTGKVNLQLKPLYSEEFKRRYLGKFFPTGVPEFDRQQYLVRLVMKNSELWKDGRLIGFSAGSDYPAVWIRDTATFIRLALFYYPLEALKGSLEPFLIQQQPDGQVMDWIDGSGQTGKNTVLTDQESSLVLAACEIVAKEPGWLDKKIAEKRVIDRLAQALDWVWEKRRDRDYGLITSGFTADWGDVENTYPDDRALDLSDRSTPVLAIYTQAKFIQAGEKLVEMLASRQEKVQAKKWQARILKLETGAKKWLYLPDKGYFLIHLVPGPGKEKFFKLEKEMLALGGNAEALAAGLMNPAEIKRFLQVLTERQMQYRLRTVSFTLIPPYPDGFFPHHLLARAWSYQNGGEWDWIGARLVKALFQNGLKDEGRKYLLQIVQKNQRNYTIFEWEDRSGMGRGAFSYSGAAGVIGEVLFNEYSAARSR